MAQLNTVHVHVELDVAPVRAKLRRILALTREVNQELAQLDERSATREEQITELRAQLAEYRIGFQLEGEHNE
jgi:hypothetical protein